MRWGKRIGPFWVGFGMLSFTLGAILMRLVVGILRGIIRR